MGPRGIDRPRNGGDGRKKTRPRRKAAANSTGTRIVGLASTREGRFLAAATRFPIDGGQGTDGRVGGGPGGGGGGRYHSASVPLGSNVQVNRNGAASAMHRGNTHGALSLGGTACRGPRLRAGFEARTKKAGRGSSRRRIAIQPAGTVGNAIFGPLQRRLHRANDAVKQTCRGGIAVRTDAPGRFESVGSSRRVQAAGTRIRNSRVSASLTHQCPDHINRRGVYGQTNKIHGRLKRGPTAPGVGARGTVKKPAVPRPASIRCEIPRVPTGETIEVDRCGSKRAVRGPRPARVRGTGLPPKRGVRPNQGTNNGGVRPARRGGRFSRARA